MLSCARGRFLRTRSLGRRSSCSAPARGGQRNGRRRSDGAHVTFRSIVSSHTVEMTLPPTIPKVDQKAEERPNHQNQHRGGWQIEEEE